MSNNLSQGIFTYELSAGTFNVTPANGFTAVSIVLVSGTGFVEGNAISNGIASTQINLVVGQPLTISTSGSNVLGNFTIATTGVIAIIGKQ